MTIQINGEQTDVREAMTVTELLTDRNVSMPDMVSVELNGEILDRGRFPDTTLNEGDRVEFLYFMGGGGR